MNFSDSVTEAVMYMHKFRGNLMFWRSDRIYNKEKSNDGIGDIGYDLLLRKNSRLTILQLINNEKLKLQKLGFLRCLQLIFELLVENERLPEQIKDNNYKILTDSFTIIKNYLLQHGFLEDNVRSNKNPFFKYLTKDEENKDLFTYGEQYHDAVTPFIETHLENVYTELKKMFKYELVANLEKGICGTEHNPWVNFALSLTKGSLVNNFIVGNKKFISLSRYSRLPIPGPININMFFNNTGYDLEKHYGLYLDEINYKESNKYEMCSD